MKVPIFNRKFWRDAGEAFLLAMLVVIVLEAEKLTQVGSVEQLAPVAIAIGRAALVAGIRAIAPRVLALRQQN